MSNTLSSQARTKALGFLGVKSAPTKNVAGVLGAFNKAISDLEAVQAEHTAHIQSCDAEAKKLLEQADASRAEVVKASNVLGKLKDLISA